MNFLGRNKNDQQPAPFDVSKMEHELLPPISYNDSFDELAHEGAERMAAFAAENVAQITPDAIAEQYEAIANDLTSWATEMVDLVRQIDKLKIDVDEAASYVLDTAQLYREAGKKSAEQVAATAKAVREFRMGCEELRKWVGGGDAAN